jgi:hypothetical protein
MSDGSSRAGGAQSLSGSFGRCPPRTARRRAGDQGHGAVSPDAPARSAKPSCGPAKDAAPRPRVRQRTGRRVDTPSDEGSTGLVKLSASHVTLVPQAGEQRGVELLGGVAGGRHLVRDLGERLAIGLRPGTGHLPSDLRKANPNPTFGILQESEDAGARVGRWPMDPRPTGDAPDTGAQRGRFTLHPSP